MCMTSPGGNNESSEPNLQKYQRKPKKRASTLHSEEKRNYACTMTEGVIRG